MDKGGSGGGKEGAGIIVFTLWYIFIAINYIIAPVFERREQRYQCKCKRAPCNSTNNSCDIPDYDIDIRLPDDPPEVPTIDDDEKPTEDIKVSEVKDVEDVKADVEDVEPTDVPDVPEETLPPEEEREDE